MKAPADAALRERALDPTRSFIVQAPAGSGKTELLTRRVLTLLATVEEPEEILAITFTRKAASEMRERVIDALARATAHGGAPPPDDAYAAEGLALARAVLARDRARDWQLLRNPGRLNLRTIDALATQLAHRLPVVSALGAPTGVVEDAWPLYREVASRFLDEHIESFDRVLLQLGNRLERAQELLAGLLAKRDQWKRYVYEAPPETLREPLERMLGELVGASLEGLAESVPAALGRRLVAVLGEAARLRRELADAETGGTGRRDAGTDAADTGDAGADADDPLLRLDGLPPATPDALVAWRAIRDALMTAGGTVKKRATRAEGCPTSREDAERLGLERAALRAHRDAYLDVLERLRALPDFVARLDQVRELPVPRYDDEQWALLEQLLAALPDLLVELQLVFAERRAVDFVELAERATRALGEEDAPTDLALAMDLRLRHLLVDEFQDTSRTQFALLERLVAGWTPGDGRSFFAVGDPMQSIYRFRDGDVALFGEARARGIGPITLEPLTLEVNFRATPALVGWVNETFATIFPERAEPDIGAVPYAPSRAHLDGGGRVELHPLLGAREGEEAVLVARLVERALAESPDATVAVLLRSRAPAAPIIEALRRAGIGCRAIDMDRLGDRPVVRDLVALCLALRYPHDRLHWLAALRSPLAGLTLGDLHALMCESGRATVLELLADELRLATLSGDGRRRARRFLEVIGPAARRAARDAIVPWVEACWLRLGGAALCRGDADRDAAERCIARLHALESAGELHRSRALGDAMASLYAEPFGDERVQLMTLHKAKGLEFDTVILPALERPTASDGVQLLDWFERSVEDGTRLLLAPIEETGLPTERRHGINRLVRRARERCDEQETLRLLYVACTRARRALHLVARVPTGTDGTPVAPKGRTLLQPLWPRFEREAYRLAEALAAGAAATGEAGRGDESPRGPPLERLAAGWEAPAMPCYERPVATDTGDAEADVAQGTVAGGDGTRDSARVGVEARAVDTLLLRQLRRLAGRPAEEAEATLAELPPILARQLATAGVAERRRGALADRVLAALRALLDDPRGRWLLDGSHAERRFAWTPDPVAADPRGGATPAAVPPIDLSFVDADGQCWIIGIDGGDALSPAPRGRAAKRGRGRKTDREPGTATDGTGDGTGGGAPIGSGGAAVEADGAASGAGGGTSGSDDATNAAAAALDAACERHRDRLERQADIIARGTGERPRVGLYHPLTRGWREWAPGEMPPPRARRASRPRAPEAQLSLPV